MMTHRYGRLLPVLSLLVVPLVPDSGAAQEIPRRSQDGAVLRLHWGTTVLGIPIEVVAELEPFSAGLD
jgi:hypothetical protein